MGFSALDKNPSDNWALTEISHPAWDTTNLIDVTWVLETISYNYWRAQKPEAAFLVFRARFFTWLSRSLRRFRYFLGQPSPNNKKKLTHSTIHPRDFVTGERGLGCGPEWIIYFQIMSRWLSGVEWQPRAQFPAAASASKHFTFTRFSTRVIAFS
jgi:hypothetical protein